MAKVFISYRREDSRHVTERIYDEVSRRFGQKNVFKDIDSIQLGTDFRVAIREAIVSADVVLAVIGTKWARPRGKAKSEGLANPDDYVRIEIETALEHGVPVIPLLVNDAKMPVPKDLPPTLDRLAYHTGAPIRSDPDFRSDIERLTAAIQEVSSELLESLKALVIDEDTLNCRLSEAALKSEGYQCTSCRSLAALKAINISDCDIVFMQAGLVFGDAVEHSPIRPKTLTLPLLVAMTNSSERQSQCLNAGMAVISRPINVPHLRHIVATLTTAVNRDKILSLGDPSLACEFMRIFLHDYPVIIEDLRRAIEARDIRNLTGTAHALKGALDSIGADSAYTLAAKLHNCRDLDEIPEALRLLEELETSLMRVRFSLRHLLRELEQSAS